MILNENKKTPNGFVTQFIRRQIPNGISRETLTYLISKVIKGIRGQHRLVYYFGLSTDTEGILRKKMY